MRRSVFLDIWPNHSVAPYVAASFAALQPFLECLQKQTWIISAWSAIFLFLLLLHDLTDVCRIKLPNLCKQTAEQTKVIRKNRINRSLMHKTVTSFALNIGNLSDVVLSKPKKEVLSVYEKCCIQPKKKHYMFKLTNSNHYLLMLLVDSMRGEST